MKTLAVKIAASEQEPFDITIKPGTTAGEILSQLNLEGYVLSLLPNPDQYLSFFEDEEDVYSQLKEGDTLCAIASAEALDAYIHQFVYGSF
jgi:hypothetical protein